MRVRGGHLADQQGHRPRTPEPPNRRPRSRRPGVTPQRPARRLAPSVPGRPGRRPLPSGAGAAAGLRGLAARERHRANAAEKFACQQTLPENARSQLTTPAFRGSESSRWSILAQEGGPPNAPGPPRPPPPSTYCGRGGRGVSLPWRPVLRYKGAEMQTALESCLKHGPADFLPSEFWGGFKFIQANDPRFEEHFAGITPSDRGGGGLSPESKTNDWDTPTAWGAGAAAQHRKAHLAGKGLHFIGFEFHPFTGYVTLSEVLKLPDPYLYKRLEIPCSHFEPEDQMKSLIKTLGPASPASGKYSRQGLPSGSLSLKLGKEESESHS